MKDIIFKFSQTQKQNRFTQQLTPQQSEIKPAQKLYQKNSLPRNIRLIIYSFLEITQNFVILLLLQENKSLKYANSLRLQNKQLLTIDLAKLSCINIAKLIDFTDQFVIKLNSLLNQDIINMLIQFLNSLENIPSDKKLTVNLLFKSCQNLDNLKIKQKLNFKMVKFNKLTIVDSKLNFSKSCLYPLFKQFNTVIFKECYIGEYLMKQTSESYIHNRNGMEQLMRINELPYFNIKTLQIKDCVFIDTVMFSSLVNLQEFKLSKSFYSSAFNQLLNNQSKYENLKIIQTFEFDEDCDYHILNKFLIGNLDYQRCIKYNNPIEILKFSSKTYQKYQRIETTLSREAYEDIIETINTFLPNQIEFKFFLKFKFDFSSDLEPLFKLNFKSLTIFAPNIILFDQNFVKTNKCLKLFTKSLIEIMNQYYNIRQISITIDEQESNKNSTVCFKITKKVGSVNKLITVYVQEFHTNLFDINLLQSEQ